MATKHETEISDLRDQNRKLEDACRQWRRQVEDRDATIRTLTQERDVARSQVYEFGDAKRQLEDAHSAAADLQQRLNESRSQVQHLLGWVASKSGKQPFDPQFQSPWDGRYQDQHLARTMLHDR